MALSAGKHLPVVVLRPERTIGNLSSDTRGESPQRRVAVPHLPAAGQVPDVHL